MSWAIWIERNARIFEEKDLHPTDAFEKDKFSASFWASTDRAFKGFSFSLGRKIQQVFISVSVSDFSHFGLYFTGFVYIFFIFIFFLFFLEDISSSRFLCKTFFFIIASTKEVFSYPKKKKKKRCVIPIIIITLAATI